MMGDVTKICTKCKMEKELFLFPPNKISGRMGVQSRCRDCCNQDLKDKRERIRLLALPVSESKLCGGCLIEKDSVFFSRDTLSPTGLCHLCKECTAKLRRARVRAAGEKTEEELPTEKKCSGCKKTKPRNDYYLGDNSDGLRSLCKECLLKVNREWEIENYPKLNKKDRERLLIDPVYRVIRTVRARISQALKKRPKSAHSIELLDMSPVEYVKFLETTFWPGMTQKNDGLIKWEIDHIVPIDSFDKTDPNWQFRAFHWSNTQALWADDNQSKGKRPDWSPSESKHELPERLKRLDKTYWSVILEPKGQTI